MEIYLKRLPLWAEEASQTVAALVYRSPDRDTGGRAVLEVRTVAGGAYFRFQYCDDAQFLIDRAGTRIAVKWPERFPLDYVAPYLVGPVMGFVLRLRGVVPLHASAVAIGDRAIALLGPPGTGKSTTAAAFAERGFAVLSDDIVALEGRQDALFAHPGYPRLCLWPESVGALYGSPDALPRITASWVKRYLNLVSRGRRFESESLPLAAIYVLGERSGDCTRLGVEPVRAGGALMTLIAHTSANYLLDSEMRAREFEFLGRLVERVPVRGVHRPDDAKQISAVCDAILDDFERLRCTASPATVE